MNFQKIIHSRCPNCGEYSIRIIKSGKLINPTLTCKKCWTKYKVNRSWTFFMVFCTVIFPTIILVIIRDNYYSIPNWVMDFVPILLWLLSEYYAPLEKYDK